MEVIRNYNNLEKECDSAGQLMSPIIAVRLQISSMLLAILYDRHLLDTSLDNKVNNFHVTLFLGESSAVERRLAVREVPRRS